MANILIKKRNRLQFTINNSTKCAIQDIEDYYEEPISKILLEAVIILVKEKHNALPVRKK